MSEMERMERFLAEHGNCGEWCSAACEAVPIVKALAGELARVREALAEGEALAERTRATESYPACEHRANGMLHVLRRVNKALAEPAATIPMWDVIVRQAPEPAAVWPRCPTVRAPDGTWWQWNPDRSLWDLLPPIPVAEPAAGAPTRASCPRCGGPLDVEGADGR